MGRRLHIIIIIIVVVVVIVVIIIVIIVIIIKNDEDPSYSRDPLPRPPTNIRGTAMDA